MFFRKNKFIGNKRKKLADRKRFHNLPNSFLVVACSSSVEYVSYTKKNEFRGIEERR